MKTLYIVRHAKSSWKYKSLGDFERPLRKKGMDDLHAMIKALREQNVRPDLLLTSPAVRAVQTALFLSHGLEMTQDSISLKSILYPGDCEQSLNCVKGIPKKNHSAMIVGHHPAVTETIHSLLGEWGEELQRVSTSSVHAIQWDKADSWEKCVGRPGQLLFAIQPKHL